jgi:hypothetical protein
MLLPDVPQLSDEELERANDLWRRLFVDEQETLSEFAAVVLEVEAAPANIREALQVWALLERFADDLPDVEALPSAENLPSDLGIRPLEASKMRFIRNLPNPQKMPF